MKWHILSLGLSLLLSLPAGASPPPSPTAPPPPFNPVPTVPGLDLTNPPAPRIQFAEPIHDFGRISSGAVVKYSFVFTNTGDAPLNVTHVAASCGCTTAGDWTRQVLPGQTGTIPIQFSSANFNGPIFKTITVSSDDKKQPTTMLQIKANVWKPVEVTPAFAVLQANSETLVNATGSVRVVNREDVPLAIEPPVCANPLFLAQVQTNVPGQDYELRITLNPLIPPTNVQSQIIVKTSSTNMPAVTLTAMVALQPVMMASPPQLYLPPAPLVGARSLSVAIMNNGTNQVRLSDAEVNITNVTVDIKETAPGSRFNLSINLPDGFELSPGQRGEVSVKTSHPQYPIVRIPVFQTARPVAPRPTMASAPQNPQPAVAQPQSTVIRPLTRPPGASRRATTPPPGPPPLPGS